MSNPLQNKSIQHKSENHRKNHKHLSQHPAYHHSYYTDKEAFKSKNDILKVTTILLLILAIVIISTISYIRIKNSMEVNSPSTKPVEQEHQDQSKDEAGDQSTHDTHPKNQIPGSQPNNGDVPLLKEFKDDQFANLKTVYSFKNKTEPLQVNNIESFKEHPFGEAFKQNVEQTRISLKYPYQLTEAQQDQILILSEIDNYEIGRGKLVNMQVFPDLDSFSIKMELLTDNFVHPVDKKDSLKNFFAEKLNLVAGKNFGPWLEEQLRNDLLPVNIKNLTGRKNQTAEIAIDDFTTLQFDYTVNLIQEL